MIVRTVLSAMLIAVTSAAHAFEISFNWDGLELCNDGYANTVMSPEFKLKDVPEGTKFIKFKMVDKNVPQYNHGGGTVEYSGGKTVAPGEFKYKSPCPPGGSHTYEWTATAQTKKNGGKLGVAKAQRSYPD